MQDFESYALGRQNDFFGSVMNLICPERCETAVGKRENQNSLFTLVASSLPFSSSCLKCIQILCFRVFQYVGYVVKSSSVLMFARVREQISFFRFEMYRADVTRIHISLSTQTHSSMYECCVMRNVHAVNKEYHVYR